MPRDAEGVYTPRTYVNDGSMLAPSIVAAYNNGQITADQAHNPGQTLQSVMANINAGNSPLQGIAQSAYNNSLSSSIPSNYTPSSGLSGSLLDINSQLAAAQKQSKIAGLQGAYNTSLSNLNQQDAQIDPTAYNDRTKTSTASQLGAKNFAEFLASRNQTNSGFSDQSELNRNMQLQNDIGAIDLQARNAHNDISTKKTNLANSLASDTAAANAQVDSDSLARQIQLMQQEQQRQDQLDQFNKQYGIDLANLTGYYNGQQTMAGKTNEANIAATNANTANQVTANNYQKQLLDQQVKSGQISNDMADAQYKEYTDPNSITNQAKALGLKTDQLNYKIQDATTQAQIDSVLANLKGKQIDNQTAQFQLDELTNPNSVTNQTKAIDLASKQQDYAQQQKINAEWEQTAPLRIKQTQEATLQATSAAQLARLQVQAEQEELLAKKIDVSNMSQDQKDKHAKALMDIQDTKSAIANRAAQLGIQAGQLKLERDKFNYSKNGSSSKTVSAVVSAAYSDYLKSDDKNEWLRANTSFMKDAELKEFMSLINKNPNE